MVQSFMSSKESWKLSRTAMFAICKAVNLARLEHAMTPSLEKKVLEPVLEAGMEA